MLEIPIKDKTNKDKSVIYCESKSTKNGFKHQAQVFVNNHLYECKINYWNRTWERYEFESVINKMVKILEKDNLKIEVIKS